MDVIPRWLADVLLRPVGIVILVMIRAEEELLLRLLTGMAGLTTPAITSGSNLQDSLSEAGLLSHNQRRRVL